MRQRWRRCVWALLASVAIGATGPSAWGLTHGPQWTIGRAVILSAHRGLGTSQELFLKLSLRNVGSPGRTPVRIFARWSLERSAVKAPANPTARAPSERWTGPARASRARPPLAGSSRWSAAGTTPSRSTGSAETAGRAVRRPQRMPSGMRLLGSYRREVSLNQTTILEVSLAPLGRPPHRTRRLEVVVMTASVVTDHQFVELALD